jgi:hypothetical protein
MPDDKQKSQPTPQRGKDIEDPNKEELDVIDLDDDEDFDDEDFGDEDLDDEDLDDDDEDDGRAMNVQSTEDPVQREADLGNRITRDDGDNDDLGALK